MTIQPVGFRFLRGGYVVPRVMPVTEPLIKRLSLPSQPEPYDYITPKRGEAGQIPTLTLYGSDGKPDIMYFDPRFERKPFSKAEATERAPDAELCEACRTRTYQDKSGDGNVSFKTPTHIAPQNSAAAVAAHEREHVSNAYADARQNNARVAYSSVRLFTANCPECGRVYISGGLTETRFAPNPARLDAGLLGQYVDMAV